MERTKIVDEDRKNKTMNGLWERRHKIMKKKIRLRFLTIEI